MGRFRITIARLLLVIAYCGFAFAALRSPSWIWASTVFSIVVASLAAATLTAVYRLGARRAFWTGFAMCGWLYLGLSSYPWSGANLSPLVVTSALMDLAYPTLGAMGGMAGRGVSTQGIWDYWSRPPQGAIPFNWLVPEPFRVICHALLTPIFGLLGGLLARRLHRTRDEPEGWPRHPPITPCPLGWCPLSLYGFAPLDQTTSPIFTTLPRPGDERILATKQNFVKILSGHPAHEW
jgi:hypothetical protein